MRPTEEEDQLEKRKAEEIIAEIPLLEGVEGVTVELGDDHDGDPSMWLVFHLRHDLTADDQWHKNFSDYSSKIDMRIIQSGITRFPYTRMRRAA